MVETKLNKKTDIFWDVVTRGSCETDFRSGGLIC
jgi:hypothetical protein